MTGQDRHRMVGSVSRALEAIELMAEQEKADVSVSEVARRLGVGRSTAHQLLRTLTAHGFAEQCEETLRYRLGTRLIRAGAIAAAGRGLGPDVTPALEELVREVKETCSIGVLANDEIVFIHRVEAQSVLRVDLRIGTSLPLLTSAIGQVILGAMPQDRSDQFVDLLGPDETQRAEACERIAAARTHGYAIVRDTPIDGINAIAAPLTGSSGRPVAGLGIAGPSFRFEPQDFISIVIGKARELSEHMAARGVF